MWRELVEHISTKCEFSTPATREQLADLEGALGITLPEELTELLSESNGIGGPWGLRVVWSTDQIKKQNLEFRSFPDFAELYMPFDTLLFFGDEGGGDQYAFVINAGEIRRPDIFLWEHESDSRVWFSNNLEMYLRKALAA